MNEERGGRYVVVSDVHLGGKQVFPGHHRAFCEFLSWIRDLPPQGRPVPVPGGDGTIEDKTILPPTTIVLLGDILEMWDPREQNRDYLTADLMEPVSILQHTDCDIVYVTGNHDADVGEIVTSTGCDKLAPNIRCMKGDSVLPIPKTQEPRPAPPADAVSGACRIFSREDTAGQDAPEGLAFPWGDKNRTFSVHGRHYLSSEKINGQDAGIEIGGVRYAFLHGHQFDHEQITYTMSEVFDSRFDPVDTLIDLATTTFTKKIPFNMILALLAGWILFLVIAVRFPASPAVAVIGLLFGIVTLVQSACWFGKSMKVVSEKKVSRRIEVIFGVLTGVILGLLLSGYVYPVIFGLLFWAGFILLSILMVISIVPRIVTRYMRYAYNSMKSRDKTIREIVEENYFNADKYSLETDVVVFGHTHVADRFPKPEDKISLPATAATVRLPFFVNTGCWVSGDAGVPCNTFATIDTDGIYLFQWLDGNITYLMHFGLDEIRKGYLNRRDPGS
jgi:UDP-2,3-diacylglucosamine pyrophosphatase LpxH